MKPISLKLRLAFLVSVLGLLQAGVVVAFSYATFERELRAQSRHVLRDKALQVRHLVDQMQDAAAVKDNAFKLVEVVTGHAEMHLAVASSETGEAYAAFSPEAAESLRRLRTDTWETDAFLAWQSGQNAATMLSLATASKTRDGRPYEVVLTIDRSGELRLLRELLITALTAAPFALGLVFVAAVLVVAVGLKPLHRFKQAVSRVSAKRLTERLDTSGYSSELQDLGQAFNLMLDRLHDSVTRLSQFSADLAHEMRTPLATVLGRTQVTLSQSRSNEELTGVLESNIEELQRLSRLVADMLFLAQAEYVESALDLRPLALEKEAVHVAEFLDLVAQERGVSISVQGSDTVIADQGLAQRAITNLLTNAIRHCAAGTTVDVRVEPEEAGARLKVINQGPPIPQHHLARLFDRFYRVDAARVRDQGGTGLGLAIVRVIMALHGGTAGAETTPEGDTCFWLFFPGNPPSKQAAPGPARRHQPT